MFLYFFYSLLGFYILILIDSFDFFSVIKYLNFIKTSHTRKNIFADLNHDVSTSVKFCAFKSIKN